MKEKIIKVLKVAPGEKPEIAYLENNLHALQDAVSIGAPYRGLIETLGLEPGVTLLLNEEGKVLQLRPNRGVRVNGILVDLLCGVFYVVGTKNSDFVSLSEANIEKYKKAFAGQDLFLWSDR